MYERKSLPLSTLPEMEYRHMFDHSHAFLFNPKALDSAVVSRGLSRGCARTIG